MDFTTDFNLKTINLTTATGDVYNLRYVMQEINVYESIYSNQITCDIVINDAQNLIMKFPIFGFETLLLEFQTPNGGMFSKQFRLHRITDRNLIRERESGYVLHFVTFEAINNLKTRVSKSYKGKLISQIVDDLHNNWLQGDSIDIETTKYQHHIIIPNLHPCHAINWLCTHANSAQYLGANYLYYQDKDQFRFVSMESRLVLGSSKTYLFQVANVRLDSVGHKPQDFATNVIAAKAYKFDNFSDILQNMDAGMYGNELLTHSHSRKLWKRYTFDYPSSFDQYKHLYQSNKLESSAKQDLNKKENKLKLHSTGHDQDNYPFLPEKWLGQRISQLQQLQNNRLSIIVPGDSDRTVGQVVEFNLPSPEPPISNAQVDDKYYKGRYLIQSLRHKIDADHYVTEMELIKDSTLTMFP